MLDAMILLPVDIEGCCVSLTVSCVHLRGLCSVLVCQICLLWATGLTVCTVNSPSGANVRWNLSAQNFICEGNWPPC